jgi:hypothetical protein
MRIFEVWIYFADWRAGAKPRCAIRVPARDGTEATKLAIDQLAKQKCYSWFGLQASEV